VAVRDDVYTMTMNVTVPVAAIAAYLRVSSKAQDSATQRSAVERAAAARGDKLQFVFQEKRSGKTLSRPELDRLRATIARGEIKRLYVFKLDRLTRSGISDTLQIVEEFRRAGCEIVSVADGFDLNGAAAEIILAVMAWAAKMERLAINERIAAARERVEAEGGAWGRPRRGHTKQDREAGRVPIDTAAVIRMKAEGRTVREISMAVKAPKSTVGRLLAENKMHVEAVKADPNLLKSLSTLMQME
jgi:DNA invertase Pin-like site-specific DNA recombinase